MIVTEPVGPPWKVNATQEFIDWLRELPPVTQARVTFLRDLLTGRGPCLGRPYADRVHGSTRHNLKELRPSSNRDEALRILFYFDPARQALLLLGGDKSGDWQRWYAVNVPRAERLIEIHEARIREEQR